MGFLGVTNQEHKAEIDRLTTDFLKTTKTHEKQIRELRTLLDRKENHIKLLTSRIKKLEAKYSNVGRKSKATDENVAEVIRLRNIGHSYSNIAKILTETSGEYICKSTVANIVKDRNSVQK